MAVLALMGALALPAVAQQYPQPQYPSQNPAYNGQYDNGQYPADPNYGSYNDDPASEQGVYAPAPPPIPSYAYDRPPVPGPDYSWVDGYWNFAGGRYLWVRGYWERPPYAGGYWVAPHYSGGRYFGGFWGGRHEVVGGFARNDFRSSGRYVAPRESYRAPASHSNSFRGDRREERSGGHFQRGRH